MIQDICTLYFESISDPSSDLSQENFSEEKFSPEGRW